MKKIAFCLLGLVSMLAVATASPLDVIGDDDASKTEYGSSGWADGKGDGTGFGKWAHRASTAGGGQSHAGFFIAGSDNNPDMGVAAIRGKAFGLYANGTGFEVATAFRAFDKPLKAGQSFSFLMKHGEFQRKFDSDDNRGGSVGITLRSGNATENPDDYNRDARFEFGFYQNEKKYLVYDKDGSTALDLPYTDGSLTVTFTLVTPDTYNLEITTSDKKTTKLTGRKLSGSAGSEVASFCLFDRNGETNNVYFNGFQILQAPE